jgi:hypothetical protein
MSKWQNFTRLWGASLGFVIGVAAAAGLGQRLGWFPSTDRFIRQRALKNSRIHTQNANSKSKFKTKS